MSGFGKIAVGVRLTRPDPRFVQCWTHLILSGLRTGDRVLPPAIELPAHWAAELLALDQFIESDSCQFFVNCFRKSMDLSIFKFLANLNELDICDT